MRIAMLTTAAALTGAAFIAGAHSAEGSPRKERQGPATSDQSSAPAGALIVQPIGGGSGPDVICGAVGTVSSFGQDTDGNIVAYSFGITACNIGTQPVSEVFSTSNHTMAGQNIFRLYGGRFEHVGQKWIFHNFFALQQPLCGTCTPVISGDAIGVGCSDPHTASRVGSVSVNGPKASIDPALGFTTPTHPMPVAAPGDTSGHVLGRLQIHKSDLYNVNFPGARFFGEVQYVAADDSAAGNADNNASWRELTFTQPAGPDAFAAHVFPAVLLSTGSGAVGGTNREEPALYAWQEFDTSPNNIVPVTLVSAPVPGDGRFLLGYKVVDNHDGTYTYEYALHNLTSDRGGRAFTIPLNTVSVTNIGFHDVDYHSADGVSVPIYSGADWTPLVTPAEITWSTQSFMTDPNANALRWGTLYNFRFTAAAPPAPVNATVQLFEPWMPGQITIPTVGPANGSPIAGDLNGDGIVDSLDLGILLASWSIPPTAAACGGAPLCPNDLNHDGVVNSLDLGILLTSWTL